MIIFYKRMHRLVQDCRRAACIIGAAVMITCAMAPAGPAQALEAQTVPDGIDREAASLPLSTEDQPPVYESQDSCLAMLKAVRASAPPSAMDQHRRHAGQAAALGLVFGVRFALGPKEPVRRSARQSGARLDVWQTEDVSGRHALAIADYRRCQNEKALEALSHWRWKR